jgi:hypothetical protein
MTKPLHFNECFKKEIITSRYFISYMNIINRKSSKTLTISTPEKHHIIPREWITWNYSGFDFNTEDCNNVVYLSVKDRILALQFLVLIFHEMGDSITYQKLTKMIARKYHLLWSDFWRSPYLSIQQIDELVNIRNDEIKNYKWKNRRN